MKIFNSVPFFFKKPDGEEKQQGVRNNSGNKESLLTTDKIASDCVMALVTPQIEMSEVTASKMLQIKQCAKMHFDTIRRNFIAADAKIKLLQFEAMKMRQRDMHHGYNDARYEDGTRIVHSYLDDGKPILAVHLNEDGELLSKLEYRTGDNGELKIFNYSEYNKDKKMTAKAHFNKTKFFKIDKAELFDIKKGTKNVIHTGEQTGQIAKLEVGVIETKDEKKAEMTAKFDEQGLAGNVLLEFSCRENDEEKDSFCQERFSVGDLTSYTKDGHTIEFPE